MIKKIHYNSIALRFSLCLLLGSAAFLASSGPDAQARPLIVTTIKPLAIIAQSAVAEAADVDYLIPSNQSPHHYSLPVSALKKIAQADLVIWVGPAFETRSAKAMAALDSTKRLTAMTSSGNGAGHDHHHDLAADPHIWLSPGKANDLAAKIQTQLGLPKKAVLSDAQWTQLTSELALAEGRTYLSHHDAFGHFAAAFGLRAGLTIRDASGAAQGVKSQYLLRQSIASDDASCVLIEPQYLDKDAAVIAAEFDLPSVMIDLQGSDQPLNSHAYADFIAGLVAQFKVCFG